MHGEHLNAFACLGLLPYTHPEVSKEPTKYATTRSFGLSMVAQVLPLSGYADTMRKEFSRHEHAVYDQPMPISVYKDRRCSEWGL